MRLGLLTILVGGIVSLATSGAESIDNFVAVKLHENGLERQPEADRFTLLRRLSADLTGLPPSIEEMEAFFADESPDAYQKSVDRLLDDPRFGERWGRHWLDVARFGESDGILTVNEDKVRGEAWKYRDAIIRAVNADLPFDQFVRYQLSGGSDPDYQALKQFIHLGTQLQNNADPNDKMFHRLDDMVATTGSAFLATTFGCARCHDHPVDPMTTKEYYQFTAIFFDQFKQEAKASKKRITLRITEPQVLKKGSWLTPGETVAPGYLRIMMRKPADYWQKDAPSKLDALASWITDVEHGAGKQLARVIVNRLWHHHFGRGIVATPNDFGELGARPSHPKLLNWLAEELINNGWHLKHIHRLILTSATYRQGAASDPAALALDADNLWLWQRRPLRLEAEIIRDRLLSVAGVLKPKMFGQSLSIGAYKKPVEDTPDKWRRSVYLQTHRTVRHPTLNLFDPPDSERSTGSRNTGTSPEGALFALNSPLVWDLAGHFAQRVQSEVGDDPTAQVRRAYQLALSRPPREDEFDFSVTVIQNGTLTDFCHVLLGLNEFIYVH